eukprot:gnl/Trimastix_PCT/1920.p1 GENE.gnl/Trimastix_PCT/1920~~gnl/Trimastix_PCT/1920.p1  ORF type:complete len:368 (+),score=53.30 gnl/Trimastix_PCT/1920:114-1217(+)
MNKHRLVEEKLIELPPPDLDCHCRFCELPFEIQGEICHLFVPSVFYRLQLISKCWSPRYHAFGPNDSILTMGGRGAGFRRRGFLHLFHPRTGLWDHNVGPPMCPKRSGFAAAQLDSSVYILGGNDGSLALSSCASFDVPSRAWNEVPSMQAERSCPCACSIPENRMVAVMGGYARSTMELYDLGMNRWIPGPELPDTCFDSSAVNCHGGLYVLGGWCRKQGPHNAVYHLDPRAPAWHAMETMPTARHSMAASVQGESIYALGGSAGASALATVERYDIRTNCWASLHAMHQPRSGLAAAIIGNTIYAMGGNVGRSVLSSVEEYDIQADGWAQAPAMPATLTRFVAFPVQMGNPISEDTQTQAIHSDE